MGIGSPDLIEHRLDFGEGVIATHAPLSKGRLQPAAKTRALGWSGSGGQALGVVPCDVLDQDCGIEALGSEKPQLSIVRHQIKAAPGNIAFNQVDSQFLQLCQGAQVAIDACQMGVTIGGGQASLERHDQAEGIQHGCSWQCRGETHERYPLWSIDGGPSCV